MKCEESHKTSEGYRCPLDEEAGPESFESRSWKRCLNQCGFTNLDFPNGIYKYRHGPFGRGCTTG